MATIQHRSYDKTVANIPERNAISPRRPGMTVLVLDAIGDQYAGAGRAVYRWDEANGSWILMFKSNVDTLTFTTETKTIYQDKIQLAYMPASEQVWDVMVRDGNVVYQVDFNVLGSVVSIVPETPGQFDGKQLTVRYAYGSTSQQLDAAMDVHVQEANPHPQYALVEQIGSAIAGKQIVVEDQLKVGDHLEFDGQKWVSVPKNSLVDGGNF